MSDEASTNALIATAVSQVSELLGRVDDWQAATPCEDWAVGDLVDHLVGNTSRFATMARGEEVDWTASAEVGDDRVAAFSAAADELRGAWGEDSPAPVGMASGEYAVHTWDLATALGRATGDLDPAVAEAGLEFMRANLTDDARGGAFGPATTPPEGTDAYGVIAAFAGRAVG